MGIDGYQRHSKRWKTGIVITSAPSPAPLSTSAFWLQTSAFHGRGPQNQAASWHGRGFTKRDYCRCEEIIGRSLKLQERTEPARLPHPNRSRLNRLTICSGWYFFLRAMCSPQFSLSFPLANLMQARQNQVEFAERNTLTH
jgi:hypothetical protein